MEADEARTVEEIWSDLEALCGEGDFDGAQEIIDEAKDLGFGVSDFTKYVTAQKSKLENQ